MENCNHERTNRGQVTKDVLGSTFSSEGFVCADCGAELWTPEVQVEFNAWLGKFSSEHRDRFSVQPFLTARATQCLEELVKQFPAADKAFVLRALTMVFIIRIAPNGEHSNIVEGITSSEVFHDLSQKKGEKIKHKVHFKPGGLLSLHSWAEISELAPAKFMEEVVLRMLSIYIESDPPMKEFWKSTVLPDLELILKAG